MWEILSIPSLELTRLLLINIVFLIRVSAVRLAHFDDCLEDSTVQAEAAVLFIQWFQTVEKQRELSG